MHVPPHTYWLELVQAWTQLVPSQLTVPPVGAVHGVPHVVAPQLLTSLLLTQTPPQAWYPRAHDRPHVPPVHVAVPFGSVGHFLQVVPQAVASLSAEQPLPHR